jgi:hypothetical protein
MDSEEAVLQMDLLGHDFYTSTFNYSVVSIRPYLPSLRRYTILVPSVSRSVKTMTRIENA